MYFLFFGPIPTVQSWWIQWEWWQPVTTHSRWRWYSETLWRRRTRLLPQPFLGLFWFYSNRCNIWPVISLWNSLCSHTDTLTQSQDLGWGFGELEVACDQTMSQVLILQICILLDFFIADMGALEAIFSHRCDSTSYSITVRIPHSCVFGSQPLLLALFVCLWAGKGFVNLRQVRMQLFEKRALNPNSYRHYLYILRKLRATGQ
jgi:hypothetical protein